MAPTGHALTPEDWASIAKCKGLESIPHFAIDGHALTLEERASIAKRKGLCVRCGVKTHAISVFRRAPLNNKDVHKGTCIECNPTSVPPKVLAEYERAYPRKNAPMVPVPPLNADTDDLRLPINDSFLSTHLDSIPHFAKNGHALTQEERASIAKRKGLCVECGVKTHAITKYRRLPLNNKGVHMGTCIKCNPTSVPPKVLAEYEQAYPRKNAPVVPVPPINPTPTALNRNQGKTAFRGPSPKPSSSSFGGSDALNSSASFQFPPAVAGSSQQKGITLELQKNQQHSIPTVSLMPEKPLTRLGSADTDDLRLPINDSFLSSLYFHDSIAFGVGGSTSGGASVTSGTFGTARRSMNEDYTGNVLDPSDLDLDVLLLTLEEKHEDPELLKQTLHRIRNFGFDQDPRGAMAEIRNLMDQYVNDARVMAIACSALWRLSAGQKTLKIESADNGAIESIINSMQRGKNMEDIEFAQWAVGCLASLATAEEVKAFIAKIGGIDAIVDVLNHHKDSAGVFEWAARALYNLVNQGNAEEDISDLIAKNITSIEEAKGIPALVGAMKNHHNEATAQRWAMKLLWSLQAQEDKDMNARVLKRMKEEGFIKTATRVLKARTTESETDLFWLSAELICNVVLSDRSDSSFSDASECLTTVARFLRDDADDSLHHRVKQESCCRVITVLMNGSDYSRLLVSENNGMQALLDAIERSPNNPVLLQKGIWAFWAMSAENERVRDDGFLVRASQTLCDLTVRPLEENSGMLLPICGFFANMCLIPGMSSGDVPIVPMVRALVTEKDALIIKEAERAVANYCMSFPNDVVNLLRTLVVGGGSSLNGSPPLTVLPNS